MIYLSYRNVMVLKIEVQSTRSSFLPSVKSASFSHLAALNFSALWVLAVLAISYLVGTEVISRDTV